MPELERLFALGWERDPEWMTRWMEQREHKHQGEPIKLVGSLPSDVDHMREIFGRWLEWGETPWWHIATVYEFKLGRFITTEPLAWSPEQSFEGVREAIYAAVSTAMEWPTLENVEQELYEPTHGKGFIGLSAVVNDALSGTGRAEEHYKFRWRMLEHHGGPWDATRRFDQQLQAFKAANPNGISRS